MDAPDAFILAVFIVAIAIVVIGVPLVILRISQRLRWLTQTRPCPRCGERVVKGNLQCDACGFDFATSPPPGSLMTSAAVVKWDSSTARTVAGLSCLAVIVGAVGPWQTSVLTERTGLEGDGVITLGLAIAAAGLILDKAPGSNWLALAGLLAVGCAFIGVYDLTTIYDSEQLLLGEEVRLVSPGWGLWLTIVGAAALAICAASLWTDTSATR
jgi:hypothetical protein